MSATGIHKILLAVLILAGPGLLFADSKDDVVYEKGKLLDIKKETHTTTTYQKQKTGKDESILVPIENKEDTYLVTVQVKDMVYVGKHTPPFSFGYKPDWIINDPIDVRFNEKKTQMILKRPDGKEYKTKVVTKKRVE